MTGRSGTSRPGASRPPSAAPGEPRPRPKTRAQTRPQTATPGLATRLMVLRALDRVLDDKQPLEAALAADGAWRNASVADRGFVYSLVSHSLRHWGRLLARLDQMLPDRAKLPTPLQRLLAISLAQVHLLDTPPHAVVATAQAAAERLRLGRLKGLVTGVLRRAEREGAAPFTALPARVAVPPWFVQRLGQDWGEAGADAILAASLSAPPLDLALKPAADREGLIKALPQGLEGLPLPTGGLRLTGATGTVAGLPGYQQGVWWVQDLAAQIPALLLGDVQGKRVLDLCAAPGGKTAQLAARGARVTAVDRSPARLDRLRENLDRLGLPVEILTADIADLDAAALGGPADLILLDAPCSATGTLRKSPELPWTRAPADLDSLVETQAALLRHVADHLLAPGGTLVTCVCSILKAEGEAQIDRLLGDCPNLAIDSINISEVFDLTEILSRRGEMRALPSHLRDGGGLDGFYAVRLRKAP